MHTKQLVLLALVLLLYVTSIESQATNGQSAGESDRWMMIGNDVMLLVRKVDETHPYFVGMRFRRPRNSSESMTTLKTMLATHCNTNNITQLVKNDQLVLLSNDDVSALVSGDRIEVWSNSSGPATRAATVQSFAGYHHQSMCSQDPPADGKGCGKGPRHKGGDRSSGKRRGHGSEGRERERRRKEGGGHRGGGRRDDKYFFF